MFKHSLLQCYQNVPVYLDEPPKDHFSENVRRMRQIQRKAKKKEREAQQPMKALWKSEKYATVQSKVADELQVSSSVTVCQNFIILLRALKN